MYQERGERQLAKRELQTTLRLNPKLALPRVFLSAILETEGESQAAQRELDQAIAINPASVNVGYGLEEFYFKEGESNGILTHVRVRKKKRTEMQIADAEPASEIESTAPNMASKSAAGENGALKKPASETLSSRRPESEMRGGRMEGGEAKEEIVASEQGREAQEIQKIEKTEPKLKAGRPGVYRVRARDTVAKIARRYGTTVAVLMGLNTTRIEHPSVLDVGTNIRVPVKKAKSKKRRSSKKAVQKKRGRRSAYNTYRIKRGDTLTKVARRYKTNVKTLMRLNRTVIEHPNLLEVGMRIKVPGSRKSNSKALKKKSARKKRRPVKRTAKKKPEEKSTDTLSTIKRTRTAN